MDLNGNVVLVTGASSGIGQAIAIACASKGARVIIHYRDNVAGAQATLTEVERHSRGHVISADLTDEKAIGQMFAEIKDTIGVIDLLVNNAGGAQPGDFFDNATWREQFENIFFSQLHVSQRFLKQNTDVLLRKIVNITSYYGNPGGGNTDYFAYSVAKAALCSMTQTLAKWDTKVLVNAIAPGYTWTPAWEGIAGAEKRVCEDKTMIGRFITPQEVAHMAVALLENDAMTGQVITIDGGLSLQTLERK